MQRIHSWRKLWRLLAAFIFLNASADVLHAQGAACDAAYGELMANLQTATNLCYVGAWGLPYWLCDQLFYDVSTAYGTGYGSCSQMFIWPKGKVISVLYMPPGDRSSVAYSTTASSGSSWTLTNSFSTNSTGSLSFNLYGVSLGANVGVSGTSSSSQQTSTNLSNTQATTWATSGNPIDHTQDVLTIWLNPQITVARYPCALAFSQWFISSPIDCGDPFFYTSEGNAAYSTATSTPVNGDAIAAGNMSLISVKVAALQNPTQLLPSQLVSRTNSDGSVVAGLLSLCAARIHESQCTATAAATNACGCTAADFAPLVQQDPFFNPNTGNHTVAAINAADPNNARFVPVKNVSGQNLQLAIQAGVTQTVALTDAHNQATTFTHTVNESYGYTAGFSGTAFDLRIGNNVTYTQTESMGSTQGSSHTQQLTLATSNPACFGLVNIYKDTLYHTFVFDNASNAPNPCP